jgi:hypothetical protein
MMQRSVLNLESQPKPDESGEFLVRKAKFLLTSSVGMTMAEALLNNALERIGLTAQRLTKEDVRRLAGEMEPSLSEFVGTEKAAKLTSALRVLLGGAAGI